MRAVLSAVLAATAWCAELAPASSTLLSGAADAPAALALLQEAAPDAPAVEDVQFALQHGRRRGKASMIFHGMSPVLLVSVRGTRGDGVCNIITKTSLTHLQQLRL